MKSLFRNILLIFLNFWIYIFETPIFLISNLKLFSNDKILIVNENSFGHAFAITDYVSRLFFPNSIAILWMDNPKINKYIPLCFDNINTFNLPTYKIIINVNSSRVQSINFYISILRIFYNYSILDKKTVYQTLSVASNGLEIGRENLGISQKIIDWTGYEFLLHNEIGKSPKFPNYIEKDLILNISKVYPEFFKKPIVCLLLREKGYGDTFDNYIRSCGKQINYLDAVKFLTSNKFNVIGIGETSKEVFKEIKGFYHIKDINFDYKILNLYFLMNCNYFIGQQSGPLLVPNSCNKPSLIVDSMPHCLGTFSKDDYILFKNLKLNKSKKKLSIKEIYSNYPDLALGYNFKNRNVSIIENSNEEILNAVKYFISSFNQDSKNIKENNFKILNSKDLANAKMRIFFQENNILT